MHIQARIPVALAAVHNFIHEHDPSEINEYRSDPIHDLQQGHRGGAVGQLSDGIPDQDSHMRAEARRDSIAEAMWIQYQNTLQERANEYPDNNLL